MRHDVPSDARDQRLLRYFGQSLLMLGDAGKEWPGFRYTPEEWQRFTVHAATVSAASSVLILVSASVVFILIAAAAIGLVFIPAMSWLYPDPAKTSALVFLGALFGTALLTIGFGYPVALDLGGRIADRWSGDARVPLEAADRTLGAKIRFQIWRMTMILCGIGVPVTLIMVIYDLDLGPVVRWLKPVAYLGLAWSMLTAARQARKPER